MKRILFLVWIIFSGGYLSGQVLLQSIDNAHTGNVISLDADATGSLVISGGVDNRAHIWDVNVGQKIKSFSDVEGYPAVLFSSNGKRFITSSFSGKIIVWDSDTKKPLSSLKGNAADIVSLAFNPVNNNIAGGGKDGKVIIWDQDGKVLMNFIGHNSEIKKVAFNAQGTKLITANGTEVKIWDGNNFTPLKTINPVSKAILAINVSYNLDKIAIVAGENILEIWDIVNYTRESDLPKASHDIKSVEFSPDDKYIAIGGEDGTLTIINLVTKEITKEILKAHDASLAELKFTEDGMKLITGAWEVLMFRHHYLIRNHRLYMLRDREPTRLRIRETTSTGAMS
jgi:WD40 repeat protein